MFGMSLPSKDEKLLATRLKKKKNLTDQAFFLMVKNTQIF